MEKEKYILNPTKTAASAYWKIEKFKIPSNMMILNEDEFHTDFLQKYEDDIYFKLLHDLKNIGEYTLPSNIVLKNCTIEEFANHINSCYELEKISIEELRDYQLRPVFDNNLWISFYDTKKCKIAATGIAEYDNTIKEGSLEWIQVSKEYRRMHLGKAIINELLSRLKTKADFVTVSGRINNNTKPELLYKTCGFKEKTIWHVLRKKYID